MSISMNDIVTMPAFSPYYPMPPARYRGVSMLSVFFKASLAAVNRPTVLSLHKTVYAQLQV